MTEIRSGIIVGPGSAAFEVMRDLVLNLPVMITPRLDSLWRLRELMYVALGGDALKRRRSDPTAVEPGDRIDAWEVMGVEPGHRLTLRFGMRATGAGVLGLVYWYALVPAHAVIFDRLTRAIIERAARSNAPRPDGTKEAPG